MNLVQAALRRPLTIVVLVTAVVLGSWIGLNRMSRDIFPPLGVPTIYVAQPFGGMDPAQMEGYLTYYYEYHFLYITGIEHVESKSIQGASLMKLQFHPGTDMSQALSEVIAYVNRARAFMPPGTVPPFIMRFDAGSVPVGYLVFSSETRTVGQMQDAALNLVRPLFATLPGVSAPPPFGGSARTILINVKPDRMRAFNLSPDQIVQAMSAANTISPSGNLTVGDLYPIVPVNAVVKNIKDLEGVALRSTTYGESVFLRDIATVEDGADIITSYALVNGRRTVYIPVTKRADASTLSVVNLVKKNLPRFQSVLPDDVKVSYEFDQSPVVLRAIKDLAREGGLGAILTGLMVLLFLRDWRTALIVVVNIPLSLLAATFALSLTGQNINLMTLGGLALAVGILVDEATVTIENIHSHLAKGQPIDRAARDATLETAVPRLLAMLCVIAVFIPAFSMTGAAKALFTPLALAVGFSMLGSYLLSSTLVPVLAVWFLRGHGAAPKTEGQKARGFAAWQARYARGAELVVRFRWPLVAVYLLIAGAMVWLVGSRLGVEIFPTVDSGQMAIRFRAPPGTKVELSEQYAMKILDIVKRQVGATNVALTMGLVGVHAPNYPINLVYLWNGGPEEGWLAIQLRSGTGIAIQPLEERLRSVFAAELPNVRISFEPSDIINRVMSFGSSTPIEVAVSGPNLGVNKEHAQKLFEKLQRIPSLRDVQFVQALDFPTINVEVNRERAGTLGVKMTDVTRSMVAATTSSRFTVANFWADPNSGVSYNLQVQVGATLDDLRNLPINSDDGRSVPLRSVANIAPGTAVGQYERYNMARVVSITANIHGADLGSVTRQIAKAISETNPPPAKTSVALRGQVIPLQELLTGFRSGLLMAIALIFLMLAANFQSIRLSLTVISTMPAVIAGVVLMLWLTGTTLNIQSAMGAIMAVGVAVANAILLVTFAEKARMGGATPREAAVEGARSRLRPILMTSAAMIAGMLPMAFGLGEGSGQTTPLGRAVIGGLLAATAATLFVLPAVFAIVQARAHRRPVSLDPEDPVHASVDMKAKPV